MTTHVVSPVEFDGGEIDVTGPAYQHLFRAKRLRVGEEIRVVDGEGRARRGVVARVDRQRGVVALAGALPTREPELRLELLVAPPRPERAAWLVEKVTELGAAAVRFVWTDRTARDERSFGAHQILRLHRIAVAAVEQCGRSVVPEVSGPHPLAELLEREGEPPRGVVLDVHDGEPADLDEVVGAGRLEVLIGPEGGWTGAEREAFGRRRLASWSLGPRVLRVETAAVAASTLLLVRARR